MVRQIKQIAVDANFFKNLFEIERKKMAKEIGILNISQINFTKMITGFEMRPLKIIRGQFGDTKTKSKSKKR